MGEVMDGADGLVDAGVPPCSVAEVTEAVHSLAEELEAILEQHANGQQRADEEIKRLRRTQNELETALSESRAERENEEMQAHEAMNIVAAEMTAVRNACSSLEDQLAEMRMVISQSICRSVLSKRMY